MTATSSGLFKLAADCDARGIWLIPGRDGNLTIDAPRGALTSDLRDRLRANKAQILALLQAEDVLASAGLDAELAPIIKPSTNSNAVCRCGSTKWRDVPIHDGQSIRRDCGRCGRFIEFPVWHGKILGQMTSTR